MPTIPVVRLSEVLYADVPTVARGRSVLNFSSPSRKRDSSHISPPEAGTWGNPDDAPFAATELRVLLPSTFAVAKRAYDTVDSSAAVGMENKGKNVLLGDNRCCTLQCDCSDLQITGNKASEHEMDVVASDSSKSCSGESASTLHCDQHHCRDNFMSKSATREARESDCLTVVVESVLGFSTLRSLLQHRSHMRPAAVPQDRPPPEDQSCLVGGRRPPQNEVDFSQLKGDSFDAGVSKALGRLVGWLRIVAATEALRKQVNLGGPHVDMNKGGQKSDGRRRDKGSVFASHEIRAVVAVDDEDTLAETAMAAVGCVSGIMYEVTSCIHQHDWSTFALEPAHPTTEGKAEEVRFSTLKHQLREQFSTGLSCRLYAICRESSTPDMLRTRVVVLSVGQTVQRDRTFAAMQGERYDVEWSRVIAPVRLRCTFESYAIHWSPWLRTSGGKSGFSILRSLLSTLTPPRSHSTFPSSNHFFYLVLFREKVAYRQF